jgi:tetratricopeptide (TPR) repeat protein
MLDHKQQQAAPELDADDISEVPPEADFGSNSDRQADLGLGAQTPTQAAPATSGGSAGSGSGGAASAASGGGTSRAELTRLWKEGLQHYLNRFYPVALDNFERLLREDPKKNYHDEYTWNAGMSCAQWGKKTEALQYFQRYQTMPGAEAQKVAKAREYIAALSGASSGGPGNASQKAAAIKTFTDAQKKLKSGEAKFKKASTARGKKKAPAPPWVRPAAQKLHAIGQPYHNVLELAKQKMSPGIYSMDMLLDSIDSFALEYDSAADNANEVATGTALVRNTQTDILQGQLVLLFLHVPKGMVLLAEPLGSYFKALRPKVIEVSDDVENATQGSNP